MTNTSSRQTVCWIKRNRFPVTVLSRCPFLRMKTGNIIASLLFIENCLETKTCGSLPTLPTRYLTRAPMSSTTSMRKAQRQSSTSGKSTYWLMESGSDCSALVIMVSVGPLRSWSPRLLSRFRRVRSQWDSVGRQPRASCKHHVVTFVAYEVSRAIQV